MAKRTTATNWEIIVKDENGAIINVNYICPHCHLSTGNIVNIGAHNLYKIEGQWETDQVCEICNKDVIVQCL